MNVAIHGHRTRFISTFLLVFLLASCVPVLVNTSIYTSQLESVYEDYENSTVQTLKQCQELIDARFVEMNNIAQQLSNDPTVNFLLAANGQFGFGPLTNDSRKLMSEMKTYQSTNSFFSEFFLYLRSKDVLISSEVAYIRLENEYGKIFNMNDWDYNEFRSKILLNEKASSIQSVLYNQLYPNEINISVIQTECLLYQRSFPTNRSKSDGSIYFFVPLKKLYDIFEPLTQGLGSGVYILDRYGNVLNSSNSAPKDISILAGRDSIQIETLNNEKMMIISVFSQATKITYVSILPYRILVNRVLYIRNVTIVSSVVFLLIGILMAVYLARMASKPLLDIYENIKPLTSINVQEQPLRVNMITASVKSLINKHAYLSELIDRQTPLLRYLFYMKLLRGDFTDEQMLEVYREQIDLNIPNGPYIAVLVYIRQTTEKSKREMRTHRVVIQDAMSDLPRMFYFLDNDVSRFIALFAIPDNETEFNTWRELLEKEVNLIYEKLPDTLQPLIAMAGGISVGRLIELNLSVNAARQAMTYYTSDAQIVWYREIYNKKFYKYPIEIENSLMNLTCAGDEAGITHQMEELYSINFVESHLSEEAFRQLVFDMVGTIQRIIVERMKIDQTLLSLVTEQIHEILSLVTVEDVWRRFEMIYHNLCNYRVGRMQTKKTELVNQAKVYIETYYYDTQLTIHSVAQAVGVSAETLSPAFREETGDYFNDYLEQFRMTAACALLDKNEKVEIIAERVGYNSAHAFRRAFKRCLGINPSTYRKIEE